MDRIFLTGSSGFVGSNLIRFLGTTYKFGNYTRFAPIIINHEIIIHLAGKAHDLKKSSNPDEYYEVNTELTKKIFDAFLISDAKIFITLSSVKAVADEVVGSLSEDHIPNPITHYGKSKLLAEEYILSKEIPAGKRVYILRPCMIHGTGNKGNLNLLFKLVGKGLPWPLGDFENKRSFCSIENICFVIKELIEREDIPSGVYNIADDEPLSTNEVIGLISESLGRKARIVKVPRSLIEPIARIGDFLKLPINFERLHKLTESYVICNQKIKNAIGKPFPINSREGLKKTFESFKN
jgi:nucleoside-diphosphate-sugar epimerase